MTLADLRALAEAAAISMADDAAGDFPDITWAEVIGIPSAAELDLLTACSPEVIKALVAVAEAAEAVRVWGQATGSVKGPEPKPEDFTYYVDIRPLRDALEALKAVLA